MKIETFEEKIEVGKYIDDYVNVEEFLEYCRQCNNYNCAWSCPSFDFDPVDYWKSYDHFHVVGKKMILAEEEKEDWENLLIQVKGKLTEELYEAERRHPGSISLSAGSCKICGEGNCSRKTGEPCRYPDKMRYSIEALGGNVGLTASRLLGIPLQWMEEGRVPDYFVLVGGLLY